MEDEEEVQFSSSVAAEPLVEAAKKNDEDRCLELLDLGADISVIDAEGKTPLHWAASFGLGKLCKELLESGAAINALDSYGCSSLHEEVIKGQPAMCRLLVDGGADLEQADAQGLTPLIRAATLVAAGDNLLSRYLETPVDDSVVKSILAACRVLLELGAQTTLQSSTGSVLIHVARMCKDYGGDVVSSTEQVCKMLLDCGVPVDHLDLKGRTALHAAIEGDHVRVCRLLLERGANINHADVELITPLLKATCLERTEIVGFLLERGAKVNHVNNKGVSALHFAAASGQEEVCKLLLSAGADIKLATEENGSLPIHLAACGGHTGTCKVLLERGSALDDTSSDGVTALFLAAGQGHTSTCKLLLERGAAVDRACCIDEQMCAPVIIAAYGKGRGKVCAEGLELVNIFMDHGVDYRTIFEVAVKRKNRDLIETIGLHTSFDPSMVRNGELLQELIWDLAEWRAMPNNLQEALVTFAGNIVDRQKVAESEKKSECKDDAREPESKRLKS